MRVHQIFFALILILGGMAVPPAAASFLFEEPILAPDAISVLDDETLLDTYVDVIIELEAVRTFYESSGFTPKEYRQFKDLLRYKVNLIAEIQKRELTAPKLQL